MSDLGFNKIAGAVLATGLVIIGLGELTNIIFKYDPPAKQGYAVAVPLETAGGAEAVEAPIDWGTELPKADVAAGQAFVAKCQSCHSFAQGGGVITGPDLYGVVGRKPGSFPGMAYSSGMLAFAAKQPIWDYDHLSDFLTNPQKYIDGTKMTFCCVKQRQDRINVIAYLHSLGSSLPIPAPKPAAAAPAAAAPPAAPPAAAPKK
jgi:cytochrome c